MVLGFGNEVHVRGEKCMTLSNNERKFKKMKRYETRKTKKRKESKKGKKGKIDTLIIRKKYIPRRKLQQNRKQRCKKSDNQPEKSHESIQGQQEPKTFCQWWMAISF